MNEIRWTDKVYLDSQGNIKSFDGCPTDETTHDYKNICIALEKSAKKAQETIEVFKQGLDKAEEQAKRIMKGEEE